MGQDDIHASLSIMNISSVVTHLFERVGHPLTTDTKLPTTLFVRYLRRKPGRGLAIIYNVDVTKQSKQKPKHDLNHSLSMTLDEQALEGSHIRFTQAQAQDTDVLLQPSGALRAESLGLSVQAFPSDDSLPALAQSCDVTPDSILLQDLQAAAQQLLKSPEWKLVSAKVIPVRYKPASRCVLRYLLMVERPDGTTSERKDITIFGKVYADRQQAYAVQSLQQRLYQEQLAKQGSKIIGYHVDIPLLPQPLGLNATLGLTFNEAIQPAGAEKPLRLGGHVLQPQIEYGRGGEVTNVVIPTEELRLTAIALARLHTSAVQLDEKLKRTGTKEAKRTLDRAKLIASANPGQAKDIQKLAQRLASRLEMQKPDVYRPAHGGFKASQLLFHSDSVFVVDFDGFCLADSALDVGYFLAYLRPSGLWYARAGMREWFEASAQIFKSTYKQAMIELGMTSISVDGILERTKLYEAVLLFKIATRRVNRLNSPRPQELSAMLREITTSLLHKPRRT